MIRWIFEDAGARDTPLAVGDSWTLNPEVFDCTFVVTKPIIVRARGGDISRLAVAQGRPWESSGQKLLKG